MTNQKSTLTVLVTVIALAGLTALVTTASQAQANVVEKVPVIKSDRIALSESPSISDVVNKKIRNFPSISDISDISDIIKKKERLRFPRQIQGKINKINTTDTSAGEVICK